MDFIKGKWSDIVLKHLKERYLLMRIWYIILHRKHCQIKGNIKKKKKKVSRKFYVPQGEDVESRWGCWLSGL